MKNFRSFRYFELYNMVVISAFGYKKQNFKLLHILITQLHVYHGNYEKCLNSFLYIILYVFAMPRKIENEPSNNYVYPTHKIILYNV